MEDLKHKCGIFGVYGKDLNVAKLTYFGLYALQHRGQESSGISVANGRTLKSIKGTGLVAQVYTEKELQKLKGFISIGHNRYSTSGGTRGAHVQPVVGENDIIALAHNGNLPSTKLLTEFLISKKVNIKGLNDSELMHKIIVYHMVNGLSIEAAIKKSFPLFTGAFCLLILTRDKLIAVRDAYGIRPLSMGKLNGGYVFSSETCAINTVSGKVVRDVKPGEMIVVARNGIKSYQLVKSHSKLDIFEFVYFARPDSVLLGKSVHQVRKNLGRELAHEVNVKADIVIPVPESSISAAVGYSQESGIPFDFGLVKNRYIGRTFILPEQRLRENAVQMKLNPIGDVVKGKSIVVIDDSIVRGTTLRKIVGMLRNSGARKIHLLISCPPVTYPDFYGIDTPSQNELIASHKTIAQIKKYIGSDSLHYLSYSGLIRATELPEDVFCTSCFTGVYPIDIGENAHHIEKPIIKLVL